MQQRSVAPSWAPEWKHEAPMIPRRQPRSHGRPPAPLPPPGRALNGMEPREGRPSVVARGARASAPPPMRPALSGAKPRQRAATPITEPLPSRRERAAPHPTSRPRSLRLPARTTRRAPIRRRPRREPPAERFPRVLHRRFNAASSARRPCAAWTVGHLSSCRMKSSVTVVPREVSPDEKSLEPLRGANVVTASRVARDAPGRSGGSSWGSSCVTAAWRCGSC